MSLPSPRAAWLVVVALRTAVAQFGTIQIDWVAEGAASSNGVAIAMPRLVGLDAEQPVDIPGDSQASQAARRVAHELPEQRLCEACPPALLQY